MAQGPMSSILVTIHITVRILEELPQFCYAGVRRRSVFSEYRPTSSLTIRASCFGTISNSQKCGGLRSFTATDASSARD